MGRPRKGPRPDSKSSPVLYAHLKVGGRWLKQSLKTTDMATALDHYPAAMKQLRERAAGVAPVEVIRPHDLAVVWDQQPDGSFVNRETEARELFDPEVFEISWEQALQLHAERQEERKGRPLAASTIKSIRRACSDLEVIPAEVTTNDIRQWVKSLKDRGYSATTISLRASLLQAVTESLVRQDLIETNPWKRVDTSAKSKNHFYEASPDDIAAIVRFGVKELIALAYTGMRVGELTSRNADHLKEGWLHICKTDAWLPKTEDSVRRLPLPEGLDLQLPPKQKTSLNNKLKLINPQLSCHSLRHSFKSAIREAGIPFDVGEYLLGHAQPGGAISSIYGSFSDEAVLKAAKRVWEVIDRWCASPSDQSQSR